MPSVVVLLTEPRSGSSLLVQLLNHCANVTVIDEPFHRDRVVLENETALPLLSYVEAHHGLKNPSPNEWAVFAQAEPVLYFRALRESNTKPLLFFKILRGHLPDCTLLNLITGDTDLVQILLKRNYLDSFISRKKAQQISSWSLTDTTDLTISLDPGEFIDYYRASSSWFKKIGTELKKNNSKFTQIEYEDYAQLGAREQFLYISRKLSRLGVEVSMPEFRRLGVNLKIQDRSCSVRDKINNYDLLLSTLRRHGLEDLIPAALPSRHGGIM